MSRSESVRLRTIVPAARVRERIAELARQIAADTRGERPLFIVIAEGARRFADALRSRLRDHGAQPDEHVVRARRTDGHEVLPAATPLVVEGFDARLCRGRDVVVLDDIADEGRTLHAVLAQVAAAEPARVRTAVLVSKHARRAHSLALDYVGFDVDDGWIVGFGMDLDGKLRELDELAVVVRDRAAEAATDRGAPTARPPSAGS